MADQSSRAHACPACRLIDHADGVDDGRLYRTLVPRVKDERRILRSLKDAQDRLADAITNFSGSMSFVWIHSAWFAIWVAVNLGAMGAALVFDQYPFGLLTLVVSLEAIFLTTFVMISQNRQAARADVRAEIDFENNVRAEVWAVHIGQALGLDADHVEQVVMNAINGYRAEMSPPSHVRLAGTGRA
jgi:uncharacterized membrane protein